MKNCLQITTIYKFIEPDGEERILRAESNVMLDYFDSEMKDVFDRHSEKVGAIERKLLK